MDMEHETAHYHGWSVAFTDDQGIPDHVNAPPEQYDGIKVLNEQDFCLQIMLCNNVMSAFRSALVSNASAQREPRV